MEQIIKNLSERLNLPEAVVRSGIGVVLNFLKQKAAGSQFTNFVDLLPGASALMAASPSPGEGGGGLLGKVSSLFGGNLGGAAEALGALQKVGVPPDKAGPLAGGFFEQAKEVVGSEKVDALLEQIPGLKSLLGDTNKSQSGDAQ